MSLCSLALAAVLPSWAAPAAAPAVLAYPVAKETLANGLDVVVIETPEFKDVVSYNTLVLAGSGNEYEKGRTGFAHLFEHILFRHQFQGEAGGYDKRMDKLGTHNNAWTWFDVTFYHPLTFTSNLEKPGDLAGLIKLEADRFTKLQVDEKTFRTESGAVLGEYRKLATSPSLKLEETVLEALYPGRGYGHSTMGYYDDVVDMPNQYETGKRFYDAYYRPNNCALVVVGDVKAKALMPKLRAAYQDWKRGPTPGDPTPSSPLPQGPKLVSVAWDADVAPVVWVAQRMPAFRIGSPESGAAELLPELLVAQASPLFKKLRYEKQTVSSLGFEEGRHGYQSRADRLLIVSAELYKEKAAAQGGVAAYSDAVAKDIIEGLEALRGFSKQPAAAETLSVIKSKYRYDFLGELASPEKIGSTFSWYYRFDRDPKVLDRVLAMVEAVQPEDVDRLAQRFFAPEGRAVVKLAYAPKKPGEKNP